MSSQIFTGEIHPVFLDTLALQRRFSVQKYYFFLIYTNFCAKKMQKFAQLELIILFKSLAEYNHCFLHILFA